MKNFPKLLILVCALSFAVLKATAQVSIGISVRTAPPELPVYEQPACPVDGYLWQPGYWAYSEGGGYYWVPGVWVAPPRPGYLWTPAYWGYEGGYYGFHRGYWGLHVGFYGGINYGYGYGGVGFRGGAWDGGRFRYNTAVLNVNRTIVRNVYVDRTVINVNVYGRRSFNGPGGVDVRPRREEEIAMHEHHFEPTGDQLNHERFAARDRNQFVSVNNGHPGAVAMDRPNGRPFNEHGHEAENSGLRHHDHDRPGNPNVQPGGGNPGGNGGAKPPHQQNGDNGGNGQHNQQKDQHNRQQDQKQHKEQNKPRGGKAQQN
jgi:hypothetical protein